MFLKNLVMDQISIDTHLATLSTLFFLNIILNYRCSPLLTQIPLLLLSWSNSGAHQEQIVCYDVTQRCFQCSPTELASTNLAARNARYPSQSNPGNQNNRPTTELHYLRYVCKQASIKFSICSIHWRSHAIAQRSIALMQSHTNASTIQSNM